MKRYFLVIPFLLFVFCVHAQSERQAVQLDSIIQLRKLSKDSELDANTRIQIAELACEISNELDIDTTKLSSNWNLSQLYLNFDRDKSFGKINLTNLELAKKLNDTLYKAYTYQNLGYYYTTQVQSDSAYYYYYKAVEMYDEVGDIRNKGETLFNMANIQETERDYIGSEKNAIDALKLIRSLPESDRSLSYTYDLLNLLAVTSHRLGNFDEAINYQNKAIETIKGVENNLYHLLSSKNNIAFSLLQKGEYNKALNIYNEILENEILLELDPTLYVTVKGNIALAKFKIDSNNTDEVEEIFKEAYQISASMDDHRGLLRIGNDISEFYLFQDKMELVKFYSSKTLKVARELNTTNEILRSLKLLSKIEEGEIGKQYLYEYINLNDSLLSHERAIRNKIARINFETDQIIAEKEQISKERLLFIFISIGLLISLTLLYIVITQRSKNRKLKFIQKQQESNEEIYNLMLAQQDKVDEGRDHEKKRISKELHDGILGRLFGTRLSLDSLNMVKTDEAISSRGQYINELKTIETEIRKISHDLSADFVSGSSFMAIVKSLIETQTSAYQLAYSFNDDDEIDWEEVPNKTKIHIYRMLQECMQNIYKHAEASLIKISFKLKNNVILFDIEDDGSGFNVNKARKGIGLKNIDSRIREVGGKAEVFSKIDIGTIIKISIPVD